MKILIIGHGRHGKDTLADIWADRFALTFNSSSMAAAEEFIFDKLQVSHGYKTFSECYGDRHNHRALWHDLICEYNEKDGARLAKKVLEKNDAYIGMRSAWELLSCDNQGIFDCKVWVDASKRLPPEPFDSCKLMPSDADIIIDNNGSYMDLYLRALRVGDIIFKK